MKLLYSLFILALTTYSTAIAQTPMPPIEAYGELGQIRSVAISPDGSKIGMLRQQDGEELFIVNDLKSGEINGANTTDIKTRSIDFINSDFVVLSASETTKIFGFRGKLEYSASFAMDLSKSKITQLLRSEDSLYPAQSGVGRIIGNLTKEGRVLMPAYVGARNKGNPRYNLFSVDPKTGLAQIFERGRYSTNDWFVSETGVIFAREDHDDSSNTFEISTKRNGKWENVYKKENSPLIPFVLQGVKSDHSSLIVLDQIDDGEGLFELNWDGELSGPILAKENTDIDYVIIDENRIVHGVKYSGMRPSYSFFDKELDASIQTLLDTYPTFAINIMSWSSDWSKFILKISGGTEPGNYFLYDVKTKDLKRIGQSRDIAPEWIADVQTIEYPARDGTRIPALLTWPPGVKDPTNLPAIILPHGGPESYVQLDFHWLAQYFASRGYLVLQPNFRGSTGFGTNFKLQGRGEWAGLMQDDVTDGLKALTSMNFVDPERVCIIGASYGGYSALAGGAFTPELYKCVAAIAPVSDLPRMLDSVNEENGDNSWVVEYWKRVIGDKKTEKQKLIDISPANHADKFQAPVLLIHGNDDTIVNIKQSAVMESALKQSGKDVDFIKVKGGDHWLSTSETRLDTLKALDTFIAKHNPAN